ncbi:MAG: hypothetical protein A2V77_00260 [Anaeromyxobacter sp. RBG_16_69_14]|nr:MAG: hypothetical protein A2V77_00260 [Anaeromyxobacter sp. RBG_16_69_14]
MRKLSLMIAALFLLASAPAFAQTSGGMEEKPETKSETGAAGAGSESKEETTTTKKTTKKKHKKGSKMHKPDEKTGAMGADGGM